MICSAFRVFALANKKAELEYEQRSMASLLAKFRIDYSDLQLIPDITKKAQESTVQFFNELIKDFVESETTATANDEAESGKRTLPCTMSLRLFSLTPPSCLHHFRTYHGK